MLLSPLTTAILLLGSSLVSAHQPMDMEKSITQRDMNSVVASFGEIDTGFTPRAHHPRSIFQKRQGCDLASDNICTQTGNIVRCCPSGYTCFYSSGDWRCDPNVLGLTRGQKIGIGIGVTVAFFLVCIIGFAIFFCCCRKAVKMATASSANNNTQPMYPPPQPMVYGQSGPGYDPAAIPLTQVGGEHKPYADNTTRYYAPPPQQGGYEQYGQQAYPPPPGQQPYPQTTSPAPPYQQPPPPQTQPQGGYHQ